MYEVGTRGCEPPIKVLFSTSVLVPLLFDKVRGIDKARVFNKRSNLLRIASYSILGLTLRYRVASSSHERKELPTKKPQVGAITHSEKVAVFGILRPIIPCQKHVYGSFVIPRVMGARFLWLGTQHSHRRMYPPSPCSIPVP